MRQIVLIGRDGLAWLGRSTRAQLRFSLMLVGAGWGVIREGVRPNSWRRTVRLEYLSALREAAGGGFVATLVVAALVGFGIVAQVVYWLNILGMQETTNSLLATTLVSEIAPVLVGVILLGRNGMLALTQIGMLTLGGQMRAFESEGVDPFLYFVVPRVLATTVASFTLGILFSVVSLSVGYIVCWVESIINQPIWVFLYDIVGALRPIDYFGVPVKFLLSGFFVSLATTLTGMDVTADDDIAALMPRGFARSIMVLMVINVAITVALS